MPPRRMRRVLLWLQEASGFKRNRRTINAPARGCAAASRRATAAERSGCPNPTHEAGCGENAIRLRQAPCPTVADDLARIRVEVLPVDARSRSTLAAVRVLVVASHRILLCSGAQVVAIERRRVSPGPVRMGIPIRFPGLEFAENGRIDGRSHYSAAFTVLAFWPAALVAKVTP